MRTDDPDCTASNNATTPADGRVGSETNDHPPPNGCVKFGSIGIAFGVCENSPSPGMVSSVTVFVCGFITPRAAYPTGPMPGEVSTRMAKYEFGLKLAAGWMVPVTAIRVGLRSKRI